MNGVTKALLYQTGGAVNNRVQGVFAGLDLEMPGSHGVNDKEIVKAVQEGRLDEIILNRLVERLLRIIFKAVDGRASEKYTYDRQVHHEEARKIAGNSIVLLKNEDKVLPLDGSKKVAFIGEFAKTPRFQGGGSSNIQTEHVVSAFDAVKSLTEVVYAAGYDKDKDIVDETLIKEAVKTAKEVEVAVIFAGLPDSYESEGYDRKHMHLPESHNRLIEEVAKVQPNTVVVLHNGSPVEMPWVHEVKSIVEAYLGGEAVGEAVVDILYGKVNPSGKLAESFPLRLEDNPSYLNFIGDGKKVHYSEGVFVGYRYYDTKKMDVLFPFGHGLSYTTFEINNIQFDKESLTDQEHLHVSVDVTNTGDVTGKEVVQLYVKDYASIAVLRPDKELKAFCKVELAPGETKTVTMKLNKRAFAWYSERFGRWHVVSGQYEILVGNSSRNITQSKMVEVTSTEQYSCMATEQTTLGEIWACETVAPLVKDRISKKMNMKAMSKEEFIMMESFPLRSLRSFMEFSNEELEELINEINAFIE